jgi:PKD repeat protein
MLIPAHITAQFVVDVVADGPGTYLFDVTADSTSTAVSDSSTATLEVVFTNLPPSADAGNDQTVDEGELVQFNGTANDPEGQLAAVRWEFGDGISATGTLTPTHTYADDGTFFVTLVVTDISGLSASDNLTMMVENVAPTVEAGSNQTADEGDTVSLDLATFTDPGTADTHTATIDWGDGTVDAGAVNQAADTVSGSHVYEDNGGNTVGVTVTDDDGDSNSDTFTVNVSNVAPAVEAGSNQTADEGDTVSLNPATFTDPGTADTHSATIDWGDGTVEAGTVNQAANTVSGSHVYADNSNYTVTVTVMDDDGESNSDSFTMTVNNVAPTVDAGSNQNVNQGDTVSLDPATFTDPGTADTHTATINWGDGTVEAGTVNQGAGTVSGSHVYTQAGTYMVTVTVTDDDGGSNSDTFTVVVVGPDVYYIYMPAAMNP